METFRKSLESLFRMIMLVIPLGGCASLDRHPIPVKYMESAQVQGMSGIRDYGDGFSRTIQNDIKMSIAQEPEGTFPKNNNGLKIYNGLVLSSGGVKGAFGAGFLLGWTDHGSRPDFKLVTGISTGALIAPFAFLGSDYDDIIEKMYTTVTTQKILSFRGPLRALMHESLADPEPMVQQIEKLIDEEILKKIAREHNRGRRLLIGTTHLDAGRFMVWNMGAIAGSGHPMAVELFRKVMMASATIPGVFPPVLIDVMANGEKFDEMHVDGGVKAQFFFLEAMTQFSEPDLESLEERSERINVFIIRNGKLGPEPGPVKRDLLDIIDRATTDMTKTAVRDSLYRLFTFTQRDGIGFNYVGIPEDFTFRETEEIFDQAEMNRIFKAGYEEALSGPEWKRTPPGFETRKNQ